MLNCEIASKQIIPALRFSVARILVNEKGMRQADVARLLGIKQASISKYLNQKRSVAIICLEQKISASTLAKPIVKLALKKASKGTISLALEKAASSKEAELLVLSTKWVQLMKKSKKIRI